MSFRWLSITLLGLCRAQCDGQCPEAAAGSALLQGAAKRQSSMSLGSSKAQRLVTSKKGVGLPSSMGYGATQLDALNVSWYYSWGLKPKITVPEGVEFVPIVASAKYLQWSPASGSHELLGFNEPDHSGQANLSVSEALALWPDVVAKVPSGGPLGAPLGPGSPSSWLRRRRWISSRCTGTKAAAFDRLLSLPELARGLCVRRLVPKLHAEALPNFYVLGGCLATTELLGITKLGIRMVWPNEVSEADGNAAMVTASQLFDTVFSAKKGQKMPPSTYRMNGGLWEFFDDASSIRLCATSTMRNKYYLCSKRGKGRIYFAPDPSQRALGNETLAPDREASICPILEYRLRDRNGRPVTTGGDVASSIDWDHRSDLPIVRTHRAWHKRAFNDAPVAHSLSHIFDGAWSWDNACCISV
eukprot:Skav236298  [mRNA]  locus=scaffold1398:78018:95134:+ [translate_table: standard]